MTKNVVRPRSAPRSAAALLTSGSLLAVGTGAGAFAAALLATPAGASAFTVTTLNSGGAGSLRQAIIDANASPGADTIDFAPGVTGEIWLTSNLPTISEGVTITGPGASALAINGVSLYHAFDIDTSGSGAVTISGLTVTHSIGTSAFNRGGAISVRNTGLNLDDVHLTDNGVWSAVSSTYGGGLFVENQSGSGDVVISNSKFARNGSSTSLTGARTMGGAAMLRAANVSITNSSIEDNEADAAGGIYVVATSTFNLDNSSISGNVGHDWVGGIGVGANNVRVTNSTITRNTSGGNFGGGYFGAGGYAPTSEPLLMSNTRISDNTAGHDVGGAMILTIESSSTIDRVTVTGNTGDTVGGLDVLGSANLSSSTIANNTGSGVNFGYGFSFGANTVSACSANAVQPAAPAPSGTSVVRVTNSTVSGNSLEGISTKDDQFAPGSATIDSMNVRPAGCGIINRTSIDLGLTHTLAVNNGGEDVAGSAFSLFSLIQKPNASLVAGTGTLTGVDPGLKPLERISDTVSVVPIEMGSAAWNAGNPNFTPPPATDQRGLPRVVDIIDIGAYEVQDPFVLPKFTG